MSYFSHSRFKLAACIFLFWNLGLPRPVIRRPGGGYSLRRSKGGVGANHSFPCAIAKAT